MESDTNEWDIASFTRKVYSKVKFIPGNPELETVDEWTCDCPAKRFYEGDCKHILAVKIAKEEHIHIPTIQEAMGEIIKDKIEDGT